MIKLTISLIISTLLIIACTQKAIESVEPNTLNTANLLGQWKFKSYANRTPIAYEVSLEFKNEDGKNTLSGRSSVNFYFASFETNDSEKTMKVGVLGSTKIAGSPEANQFESIYYERLRSITHYEFTNTNTLLLHLSSPAREVMIFERK